VTKVIDVDKTPVAHELMCYNPKEKANTWHVVVNHDSKGYVDRVQCKVTGVIRKYKKQNVVKSPAAAAKAIRKTAPGETDANGVRKPLTFKVSRAEALEESWFKGVKAWRDKEVLAYSPETPFKAGDVLEHPNFGKGVVQLKRDNKIEVLFKSDLKVLMNK